ncbi:MAG TPA: Ku protein, partial [Solirubrobacteraceae bacterium]|nr:Ku protein [Solirubrobacteraceae bacterium]
QPETEEAAPVPDLMAALKASLDAVQGRDGGEVPTAPAKAKPKKAAPRKRAPSATKRKTPAKSG